MYKYIELYKLYINILNYILYILNYILNYINYILYTSPSCKLAEHSISDRYARGQSVKRVSRLVVAPFTLPSQLR